MIFLRLLSFLYPVKNAFFCLFMRTEIFSPVFPLLPVQRQPERGRFLFFERKG